MATRTALGALVLVLGCMTVAAGRERDDDQFDYFLMVVQWPLTLCEDEGACCQRLQWANFTIHGLWPERFDETWPSCCHVDKYPFEPEKIEDLQRQLDLNWPPLRCKPPRGCGNPARGRQSFHRHEWEKHGTCSISVLPNIRSYFRTVLSFKDSIDILGALEKADIFPSEDETYTYMEIRDAIADDLGSIPHLECKNGKLSEVFLCLNKYPDADNIFELFDCPLREYSSCKRGHRISFPAITPFLDSGSQMKSAI